MAAELRPCRAEKVLTDQAGARLSPHLWMTWLDNWALLREASTALAAPRGATGIREEQQGTADMRGEQQGTTDMRGEQQGTFSPLFFWVSKHHSVFRTLLVLQLTASHWLGDTALSPATSVALPMGTTRQERLQGFVLEARASESQIPPS